MSVHQLSYFTKKVHFTAANHKCSYCIYCACEQLFVCVDMPLHQCLAGICMTGREANSLCLAIRQFGMVCCDVQQQTASSLLILRTTLQGCVLGKQGSQESHNVCFHHSGCKLAHPGEFCQSDLLQHPTEPAHILYLTA